MSIPKLVIHREFSVAVSPTEEQLLEYYKDAGYNSLEEIKSNYPSIEHAILEWYQNTDYTKDHKAYQVKNNIFHYENDNEEDSFDLISDEQWEEEVEDGLIY